MLIYSKSGEVLPYRVDHIDSIKFLTDEVDLSLNPTVAAHENGKTGWMKLKVGSAGSNVQRIQVILLESFMIAKMNDMQCSRLFTSESMALPYRTEAYTSAWNDLKPGSAYYAIAMAKNADGKWPPSPRSSSPRSLASKPTAA